MPQASSLSCSSPSHKDPVTGTFQATSPTYHNLTCSKTAHAKQNPHIEVRFVIEERVWGRKGRMGGFFPLCESVTITGKTK